METSNNDAADLILREWDDEAVERPHEINLPSQFQPNQVVHLKFRKDDIPFTATVRGVHFYVGKVKYDLGLWLGDGSVDHPETETRIYNVDSVYVIQYT